MSNCKNLKVINTDVQTGSRELEICDNVMECVYCSYILQKTKQSTVDLILATEDYWPREITRVKVPILPLPVNKPYYSFNGIETIIYNLFRTTNKKHQKRLKEHSSFLKIYYEKDSLFTLPIIQIEILFFGRLHSRAIDELWDSLKKEVLYFTGSVGDIDVVTIEDDNHLEDLMKTPLILGYPEFKQEGVLLEHKFSPTQIKEMNYLHTVELIPLDMTWLINNRSLEFFQIMAQAIKDESEGDELKSSEDELIKALFPDELEIPNEADEIDDYTELPF